MRKVPIKFGNLASVLKMLGSLYRNPAEAIKEHVSNAIDEHLKAQDEGRALPVCEVTFTLQKDTVTIEYPYGMSKEEFERAIQSVAESGKKELDIKQIGQLGIGMFSFFQIGKKCTFFSKRDKGAETVKVGIRDGSDDAEFETAKKKESLRAPGIRIVISGLQSDPTKPRGPLCPTRLQKVFGEKFSPYLKDGSLRIAVYSKGTCYRVEPPKIDLPRIAESYSNWALSKDPTKRVSLELYFHPSGKGTVGIRHKGVPIVEDIRTLSAYGLEESVYAAGDIGGFIDADFLDPLPARSGFEENDNWLRLLDELDKRTLTIEDEVDGLKEKAAEKKLTEIQRKAIELARAILNTEDFEDLELLGALGPRTPEPRLPPNGFDFVPSSIRIDPGKTRSLPLKALVPKVVPDCTRVEFSISDSFSVGLGKNSTVMKASEADEKGVVSVSVPLQGILKTHVPVALTARTQDLVAEARVRVTEAGTTRERVTGREEREGWAFSYLETAFEDGPSKHSRYVPGILQINTLNPDYKKEKTGTEETKLAYCALMIGKETIAYNDKSGAADEHLERILTFYFQLKDRLVGAVRRPRGRPKRAI